MRPSALANDLAGAVLSRPLKEKMIKVLTGYSTTPPKQNRVLVKKKEEEGGP
jgi:hypothetical protein